MKNLTLIYCGENGDAGRALAETLRKENDDNKVILCSTEFFSGPEADADKVIIMPDVQEWRADSIREAYPGRVVANNPIVVETIAPKSWAVTAGTGGGRSGDTMISVTGGGGETIKTKRGWPKGKSRKAVA